MDFGKLPDLRGVDFSRPTEPPRNVERLRAADSTIPPQAYVGCPVWAVREWVGKVYPPGTLPADYLRHYSRQLNCIELNSTHYRVPDPATIRAWRETVPEGFRFCPKVHQEISHGRQLRDVEVMMGEFVAAVSGLGPHLGPSFLQLPPTFSPVDLARLRDFLRRLPPGFRLAVEFRHPGWFRQRALIEPARELLERQGAVALITDVAGRRDVLHLSLTAPTAMIRFVGNALDPTDYTRIDAWGAGLGRWFAQGLQELYFIIHQPENLLSPELSHYLVTALNRLGGPQVADWVPAPGEKQLELFGG